ncbi:MAG: hypothetical protein RBS07_16780 [Lentimicrobium sp.]|jgi:hypothetical protein|nr:hypothetical protein [Lentimicrobium sp.]
MKTTGYLNKFLNILVLVLFASVLICCKKDKPIPIPEPVLESSYDGTLVVESINTMPPWSETSIGMNVFIDGEFGVVEIEDGSLEYNGDTIINNDSKIERGGFWNMSPVGSFEIIGGVNYLNIDARISVLGDVQNVYGKDNNGNWVLLSTFNFTGTPNSDLAFILQDAIDTRSVVSVADQFGSITWTLSLVERP